MYIPVLTACKWRGIVQWSGLEYSIGLETIALHIIDHFVCSTLVASWLPLAFFFSHLVFFAVGLWVLHDRKSLLPVVVVSVHRRKSKGGATHILSAYLPL